MHSIDAFPHEGNPFARGSQPNRLQQALDDGDRYFFDPHPDQQHRLRLAFPGEHIEGGGELTRYVVVTRLPDGTLTRRYQRNGNPI